MRIESTFTATVYAGFRIGYGDSIHSYEDAKVVCQAVCDEVGLCVTLTKTEFIYSHGSELGVAIGLIRYPRFPREAIEIKSTALALAEKLRVALNQTRVTVVLSDETIMLEAN